MRDEWEMLKPVMIAGDESLGGVYVLRLRLARAVAVHFGRYRQEEPVLVPAGECLYVGSAMRGLGVRLLRHAGRTDANRPQSIRVKMAELFVEAGLMQGQRPFLPKRLHWHIDYLLERPEVTLTHVIALRTAVRLETAVAHWLLDEPVTFVFAPGLGARDDPGGTHLLGVRAAESWWARLPQQLLLLDEMTKAAHNSGIEHFPGN